MHIFPKSYEKFKCIAEKCKHNCCIGWEIDVDEESAAFYESVPGDFGKRLRNSIEKGEVPCFILGENERCPFLNRDNLCDIIINLGEDKLCTICSEHPRFHNELPDRTESGVGMACEEAARIILTEKEQFSLINHAASEDEIITLRDRLIAVLTNREKSIDSRVLQMLREAGASLPEKSIAEWAKIFLSLERLDEKWTEILCSLSVNDTSAFRVHMEDRMTEYEQFLCYLIYRHFANSWDLTEAAARAAFAALGYKIIFAAGAATFEQSGSFTVEDQVELCRLFSSEVEYSEENLSMLFEVLKNEE
ncbi:MAG: flagellin lysine-N-methylase [Clostridia bacterium]|nr:flagellin lysine-N-methylase [Clostridia bacterium]